MNNQVNGALQSDEQVIATVIDGNTAAFELLMRRYNQRLFRLARSVVGNDTEAEDVVQEAFFRAYGSIEKFEGRSSFATWLTRITFHEALRSRRKQRRALVNRQKEIDRASRTPTSIQAEVPLSRMEARNMLTQAYDKLSTTHRTVIMLRLVEGLSTRETAQCLRVSESNVKVLLHRAKAQLLEAFEERAIPELREQFSFAGERCDRIVAGVMSRIG